MHMPSYGQYSAFIAISDSAAITGADRWAVVVFEMFNLQNTDQFELIRRAAADGFLDQQGFAEQCVEVEFDAMQRTREYFRDNPLPEEHRNSALYQWVTSDIATFEEYKRMRQLPGTTGLDGNFDYYGQYYETWIAPEIEMRRKQGRSRP
jgi:hypothetical protein